MNTALIIYIANIVDQVRIAAVIMSIVGALGSLISAIILLENNQYTESRDNLLHKRLIIVFLFVFSINLPLCALLPSSEAVYKIAGVKSQETGTITVDGRIKN